MYEDQMLSALPSQIHIFSWQKILEQCEELAEKVDIENEDICSTLKKQVKVAKLINKTWTTRDQLLKEMDQ